MPARHTNRTDRRSRAPGRTSLMAAALTLFGLLWFDRGAVAARAADPQPQEPTPTARGQAQQAEGDRPLVLRGAPLYAVFPTDFIPALDDARLVPATAAGSMRDDETVLGFEQGGAARAYPLVMLERHEVINDRLGDQPILITWCSLVGTASVFTRTTPGRTLSFGLSGGLWKDGLVLYDRETGTLWSQVTGQALDGPLGDRQLRIIGSTLTDWKHWRQAYPDTLVLLRDPRVQRDAWNRKYESDPDRLGVVGTKNPDARLPGKARVLGVPVGTLGNARGVAYALDRFTLLEDTIEGAPVLVWRDPGTPSGRVFRRTAGGHEIHLRPGTEAGRALDRDTGSEWDLVSGRAIAGRLAGSRLEPVLSLTSYWFAWVEFNPGSDLRPAAP